MPIYDNDGTTNYEIASIYDYDGTTNCYMSTIHDNDGTTSSLIYSGEKVIANTSSHSSLGSVTNSKLYIGYDSGYGFGADFISGSGIKLYGWYVHYYWLEFKHQYKNSITTDGFKTLKIQFTGSIGTTDPGHSSEFYLDVYINNTRKNITKHWSAGDSKKSISGTFSIDVSSLSSFTLGFFVNIYGYLGWDVFIQKIWLE